MTQTRKQPQMDAPKYTVHFNPLPIKRAMAMHNLTLKAVASHVGCSVDAVWRITKAKTTRPAHLHAICKMLGVKVEACYPLPAPEIASPGQVK